MQLISNIFLLLCFMNVNWSLLSFENEIKHISDNDHHFDLEEELFERIRDRYFNSVFSDTHITYYNHIIDSQQRSISENELRIPDEETIKYLHITGTQLKTINDNVFKNFNHLIALDLSENENLQIIQSQAFFNLTNLKKLNLNNCKIDVIYENTFESLKSLLILTLQNNQLWNIYMLAFKSLQNLQVLDLSRNNLKIIPPLQFSMLKNLKILDLHDNPIKNLDFIRNNLQTLKNLKYLNLENTQLSIERDNCFYRKNYLVNLEVLVINKNWFASPLEQFKFHTRGDTSSNLLVLSLVSTFIVQISNMTFYHLKKLEILDLSRNNLQHLQNDTFIYLINLKYLAIKQAKLVTVPYFPKHVAKNIILLHLIDNEITELTPITFKYMLNLQTLILYRNKLTKIDENTFTTNKKLRLLDLSSNGLQELSATTFTRLQYLETLRLARNQFNIKHLNIYFKNTASIRSLDLSFCQIHEISNSIFELHDGQQSKIDRLDLSNNQLTILKNQTFLTLTQLHALLLGQNRISQLETNTFSHLTKLEMLDLTLNEIVTLPEEIFKNLLQLRMLSLTLNRIRKLPAKIFHQLHKLHTLGLQGNQLEILPEELFKNLYNLKLLDLTDNQIRYINPNTFLYLNLSRVSLIRNHLTFLTLDIFSYATAEFMLLDENPWQCECLIQFLINLPIKISPSTISCVFDDQYDRCVEDVTLTDHFTRLYNHAFPISKYGPRM